MSRYCLMPCLTCGKTLRNTFEDEENQPSGGTEFRTYGHYGSTFWDSFDGEELVINVCDECLNKLRHRLAMQKRFLPIRVNGMLGYGRQWVTRPLLPYTQMRDETMISLEPEELGTDLPRVEWPEDIEARREHAIEMVRRREEADGQG